jgi:hypothetical protein
MIIFSLNLNQVGLVFNIIGSILIGISVVPVKANAYLCDPNNKPIKPLAVRQGVLYVGLILLFLGFILMFIATF